MSLTAASQEKHAALVVRVRITYTDSLPPERDLSSGPVVTILPFNAADSGSIPDWGTKIPHALGQLNLRAATTRVANTPQLLSPCALEAVLHKRSPCLQKDPVQPKEKKSLSSAQLSRSLVSNSLRPHESQHARPPCPSPTPGFYSNSCPSSR